jgi:hypothetical protein
LDQTNLRNSVDAILGGGGGTFWKLLTSGPHRGPGESPSLVLVINDTKLLMTCVKWFKLGISNTCDEGACGMEWWPQDHKEMVHGHEMMVMVIKHEEMDME